MEDNKDIYDVMICPYCNSDNCNIWSTDEIYFDIDGTGHYYTDCRCYDCRKDFRLYTDFKYSITKAYTI